MKTLCQIPSAKSPEIFLLRLRVLTYPEQVKNNVVVFLFHRGVVNEMLTLLLIRRRRA